MSRKIQVEGVLTLAEFDAGLEHLLARERKTPQVFDTTTSSRLGQLRKVRGTYTVDQHKEYADYTLINQLNKILSEVQCCIALDVLDAIADAPYLEEHPDERRRIIQAEEVIQQ